MNPANRPVRLANEFRANPAHAREGLWRALVGVHRRWSESVTRAEQDAPTLRPQAVNVQVEGASSDYGSEGEGFPEVRPATADEWRALAAAWGIGGLNNAIDELAKADPESAPEHIIDAARLLRFVAEDLGIDSRHPLASETWRAEP